MAVVKNKRNESRFEANHHFLALRQSVTDLVLHDFGYSESKYQKLIEFKLKQIKDEDKSNGAKAEWQIKDESFRSFFIDQEAIAVLDLLRKISIEFNVANSIFPADTPSKLFEYLIRRWHLNNAIGYCNALKVEIQYIIQTLPVDINRYIPFAEAIDEQIQLFKGVRLSDNRFLRPGRNDRYKSFTGVLIKTIGGITNIVHRILQFDRGIKEETKDQDNLQEKESQAIEAGAQKLADQLSADGLR